MIPSVFAWLNRRVAARGEDAEVGKPIEATQQRLACQATGGIEVHAATHVRAISLDDHAVATSFKLRAAQEAARTNPLSLEPSGSGASELQHVRCEAEEPPLRIAGRLG